MLLTSPINSQIPREGVRHTLSSSARPCREMHHPCTGARSATSHWMSLTVHLAEAHVYSRRSRRRDAMALSTRWPSSHHTLSGTSALACRSCRSRGRTERVHRSLENAQRAFPTATTGIIHHDLFKELILPKWYKGMRVDDRCVAADAPGVVSTGRIAGRELAAGNRSARFPAPVNKPGAARGSLQTSSRPRPALRHRQPCQAIID